MISRICFAHKLMITLEGNIIISVGEKQILLPMLAASNIEMCHLAVNYYSA